MPLPVTHDRVGNSSNQPYGNACYILCIPEVILEEEQPEASCDELLDNSSDVCGEWRVHCRAAKDAEIQQETLRHRQKVEQLREKPKRVRIRIGTGIAQAREELRGGKLEKVGQDFVAVAP